MRTHAVALAIAGLVAACAPTSAPPPAPPSPSTSTPVTTTGPSPTVDGSASELSPGPTSALSITGRIAFDRLQGGFGYEQPYLGTFVLDAASRQERRLTIDYNVEGLQPTWSPQGQTLLVSVFDPPKAPGRPGVLATDGSGLTLLSPKGLRGSLGCTSWSPDGTKLACSLDDDARPKTEGIYVLDLDTRTLARVTASPNPSVEGRAGSCGGGDFAPAFAPGGDQIAFIRAKCGTNADPSSDQTATLCLVDADGSNLRTIVDAGGINSHGFSRVAWSPDGARLLFGTELGTLETVAIDGSDLRQVPIHVLGNYFAYTPTWSPDGSMVLFSMAHSDATELYVVHADGSSLTPVTDVADAEVWATWTAD
jgi:Tol biopolymer transport system component